MNFLLSIIVLLVAAKLLGELFERLGLPSLLGELLAGVIFGSAILGWIAAGPLEIFALLGIILLLFLVGFNFSIEKLKAKGKSGIFITLFGFIFVLVPTYFVFKGIGLGLIHAIFFSLIMGGESTPNTIKTLVDLKQLHSKVSEVIISATIVEDFILYTILAFTIAIIGASSIFDYSIGLVKIAIFFVIFLIMERVAPIIIRYSEAMRAEEVQFAIAFALILLLAYFADVLGFASVVGAFFAGIVLAYSPYLKTGSFSPKMAAFTYGVFAPLFFAWMGLDINPAFFSASFLIVELILLGVVAKLIGNVIGGVLSGTGLKESVGAAIGLSTRGGEQLLILVIAAQVGVFGAFVDSILLPVTIITMLITLFVSPALLKLFFKKYA